MTILSDSLQNMPAKKYAEKYRKGNSLGVGIG